MSQPNCEIVCVPSRARARWLWRARGAGGVGRTSKEKFELFYECVTDARREGYEPLFAGKRIVCGAAK
jgi:hypothetical protein